MALGVLLLPILVLTGLSACGGDDAKVDDSQQMASLSEDEQPALCEWSVELANAKASEASCEPYFVVVDECTPNLASVTDACPNTVGDFRKCIEADADLPCDEHEECEWLLDCNLQ